MNRSQVIGALMCGIVLENGSDCPGFVQPETPLNLCSEHLKEAARWYNRNDESVRPRVLCQTCGEREGLAGTSGYRCTYCGYQSPDFEGTTRVTPAEAELLWPSSPEPRAVNVVYYLRFGDRIKIGTSSDFRRRVVCIPNDEVLALERGSLELERHRQAQFSTHRVTGEWFTAAPDLLEHAAALAHPQGWAKQLREWEGKSW